MDMRLGEVRCCYCKLYFKPECQINAPDTFANAKVPAAPRESTGFLRGLVAGGKPHATARRQTRKGKKQYMALCPRCGNEMIILKKNGFGNAQTLPVE